MQKPHAVNKLAVGMVKTPWGKILLAATPQGIVRIGLPGETNIGFFASLRKTFPRAKAINGGAIIRQAAKQLSEYFAGKRTGFTFPIQLHTTPFQTRVLKQLQKIKYGKTHSYGDIAVKVGNRKASRAVGQVCGSNPLPIVIPCHRIIATDGSLGGFGGGLKMKTALLALEQNKKSRQSR